MDEVEGGGVLGGPAAARTAALAADILATVARRCRDSWPEASGIAAQAHALRARCEPLAELDARAFAAATEALEQRDASLVARLEHAADVPIEIARVAADVCELAALTAQRADDSLRADAVAAALLAEAAARAAAELVAVNLVVTADDERLLHARAHERAASDAARRASAVRP